MRYVEAGGVRLSAIGLGTWQFGSRRVGVRHRATPADVAPAIVHRSLDLGVNVFDTAEAYAFGRSETILGRGPGRAARRGVRGHQAVPGPADRTRWSTGGRGAALGGSGSTRSTSTSCTGRTRWCRSRQTMAAMAEAGRRTVWSATSGVSNYSLAQWQEAERALGAPGARPTRSATACSTAGPRRSWCPGPRPTTGSIIAYSPLGQGLLSGRYDVDHLPGGHAGRRTPAFLPENLEPSRPAPRRAAARWRRPRRHPAQVALAWLLRTPNVVVIPGASSVAQAEGNAAAADLELERRRGRRVDGGVRRLPAPSGRRRGVGAASGSGRLATRFQPGGRGARPGHGRLGSPGRARPTPYAGGAAGCRTRADAGHPKTSRGWTTKEARGDHDGGDAVRRRRHRWRTGRLRHRPLRRRGRAAHRHRRARQGRRGLPAPRLRAGQGVPRDGGRPPAAVSGAGEFGITAGGAARSTSP